LLVEIKIKMCVQSTIGWAGFKPEWMLA
jgi:hypothetical protein